VTDNLSFTTTSFTRESWTAEDITPAVAGGEGSNRTMDKPGTKSQTLDKG